MKKRTLVVKIDQYYCPKCNEWLDQDSVVICESCKIAMCHLHDEDNYIIGNDFAFLCKECAKECKK